MKIRGASCYLLLVVAAAFGLSCARSVNGPGDNTWRFLPGRIEPVSFSTFRGGRPCWVYLPPGYAVSDKRYPVLYLNDGEWAFDGLNGMKVHRICEGLIRRGEIEPIIVVAIGHGTPVAQRFMDYTPWLFPNSEYETGGGDNYLRAVRDSLKPEVDRRYRTLRNPENTGMSGMSLGGLISVYAVYAYDSTFGKVGAFSPSYGWSGGNIFPFLRTRGRPRSLVRFYQDTGSNDNLIWEMETVAREQRFELGVDFMSVTQVGGWHRIQYWEHRFPDMLRFLFKR